MFCFKLILLVCQQLNFVINIAKMGNAQSDDIIQKSIDQGAVIIDVRTPTEHAVYSHPRAKNIPLSTIETSNDLPEDKEKPIIVHCLSGHRSENAATILKEKGFKNVVNGGSIRNILRFAKNLPRL
jgi:phage shock protein E